MENNGKKRIFYRVCLVTLSICLFLYIAVVAGMACYQDHFIFPGIKWQGTKEVADLHCTATENDRIIDLTTASGVKTKARIWTQASQKSDAEQENGQNSEHKEQKTTNPTIPTVIYIYGNCGCLAWSDRFLREFHEMGVNAACVEWPGFGVAEGEISEKGTYEAEDALYDYLTTVEKVPPESLYIMGHSLGTGPAADLASRKQCAGLILASGFTTIPDVSQFYYPYLPGKLVVVPQFATIKKIPKIKAPILFIHSRDDRIIPFEMSEKNYEVAQKCGLSADFLRLETAGHDLFFKRDESPSVWERITKFLAPGTENR